MDPIPVFFGNVIDSFGTEFNEVLGHISEKKSLRRKGGRLGVLSK